MTHWHEPSAQRAPSTQTVFEWLSSMLGPLTCFKGLCPSSSNSHGPPAPSCMRLSQAWNETARLEFPKAGLGHDEGGACLRLTIDPLTFNWVYVISEHKINFSGEVGQIKQLVPVLFSGSQWAAATPQKWALRHAISWKHWVRIFNILQGNKDKGPNLVITWMQCHLGGLILNLWSVAKELMVFLLHFRCTEPFSPLPPCVTDSHSFHCMCVSSLRAARRPVGVPSCNCWASACCRSAAGLLGPGVRRGDQWHHGGQDAPRRGGAFHLGGRGRPLR